MNNIYINKILSLDDCYLESSISNDFKEDSKIMRSLNMKHLDFINKKQFNAIIKRREKRFIFSIIVSYPRNIKTTGRSDHARNRNRDSKGKFKPRNN